MRIEWSVDVALPLHFKYPNIQTKTDPDGKVSGVTGSQKSGSKPFSQDAPTRKTPKGQSFADDRPTFANNASSRGGVAVS